MKVIQSSLFRSVSAILVGVLVIKYREQAVTWITICIGVLFFLSGVISCATYYGNRKNTDKTEVVWYSVLFLHSCPTHLLTD